MTTIGQNQNSARKKRLRRAGGSYANAFGTVTLVTSNLLILAASNVLFPAFTDLGFGPCPSPCPRAPGVQKGGTCDNTRPNSNSLFKFFQDTAYQI